MKRNPKELEKKRIGEEEKQEETGENTNKT
jgi:hypothetical protein